jgi:hypothetical protein
VDVWVTLRSRCSIVTSGVTFHGPDRSLVPLSLAHRMSHYLAKRCAFMGKLTKEQKDELWIKEFNSGYNS